MTEHELQRKEAELKAAIKVKLKEAYQLLSEYHMIADYNHGQVARDVLNHVAAGEIRMRALI